MRASTGLSPQVARGLWDDMEKAQDYSFNKSHAACYALIAYRTAYLKAHYPAQYMAALISSVMNTKDRVPFYVNACDEMGIEVVPPDANSSQVDFAVVEGRISFGLNAVKNVGEAAAQAIVAAREAGGPYVSLWDFTERVDPQLVNKRALESIVKAGALDSTGNSRKGMLDVLEQALSYGQTKQPTGRSARRRSSTRRLAPTTPARPCITRRSRPRSSTRPSCCDSRRRRSASTSPSIRCTPCATSCGGRPTVRSPTSSDGATATSSRRRHRVDREAC